MSLVKITDLTGQLGVSSRTLRYYEEAGLIRSIRPGSEKFRFYDTETIERLKQIQVLRKMQIPIKDILHIFESQDMQVVVQAFVARMDAIDREVTALTELRRIVDDFLQTMLQNGVSKISALPLLYEEMGKQLELTQTAEAPEAAPQERLTALAGVLQKPLNTRIVVLPQMRLLSSVQKESGRSDPEGFWSWLSRNGLPAGLPGQHALFESQDDGGRTVILQKVEPDFLNTGPYDDYLFSGGLFAAAATYADEDLAAFSLRLLAEFNDNPYYEIDYLHGGALRHPALVETVLSPDGQRELIELFLPVKKRLADAALYLPGEQAAHLTQGEIEAANPILWEKDVPMDGLVPIMGPYYSVNEQGEAEYIAYIDKRFLSTEVEVKLPFRVDICFRADSTSYSYGHGADEGGLRVIHGGNYYGINMENNAALTRESILFHQPVLGDLFRYPGLGRINPNVYNRLTWIVGKRHLAVIINGEVRYCGVKLPYMSMDLRLEQPHKIIIGSDGSGKKYFSSIRVAQLKEAPKINVKEGAITMQTRQSNNLIPNLHQLITMHYGENYWFNGCAKYVMEGLKKPEYDYWFFAGLTGDILTQYYSKDSSFRGDAITECLMGKAYIEGVFRKCGYASTFVPNNMIAENREMYLQTLMAYIDKGVPVIRYHWCWSVFVGYEEFGKTLLYMTADHTEPQRVVFEDVFTEAPAPMEEQPCGWIFVGEQREEKDLKQLYRDIILDMPRLLTAHTDKFFFGAEALRAWAADIDRGRFEGMQPQDFDSWPMHTSYVCALATNASCCQAFFDKALELNPDLTFIKDITAQYKAMQPLWEGKDIPSLEALGGGFNVTLEALQNPERRGPIAACIRASAACMDKAVEILQDNLACIKE